MRGFFYPKALSSWNLFHLQINDATFRKHILVQFVILFEYLLSFTVKPPQGAKQIARSAIIMTEAQEQFLRSSLEKVYSCLRKNTAPGDNFVETLKFAIKCDNFWVSWKNEGCSDFEKKKREGEPPKKRLKSAVCTQSPLSTGIVVIFFLFSFSQPLMKP